MGCYLKKLLATVGMFPIMDWVEFSKIKGVNLGDKMKLSVKAVTYAGALLTGGAVLFFGILNLIFPGYADAFLRLVASVYPGYHYPSGLGGVIIGTLYGIVDGAVTGLLIAWLYNLFVPRRAA